MSSSPFSPDHPAPPAGQRGRIVPPQPPAPVPVARPKATRARQAVAVSLAPRTESPGSGPAGPRQGGGQSDGDVVRSTGSMAIATLVSRITGFLRNVAIGATMGPAVGSAFNTANTLPNLITEIVLGAVLTSLVVPVLVRAEKEDPDQGAAFIRRLLTTSATLLIGVTVLAVVGAPLLTRLTLGSASKVNLTQSTSFAYLLLPQIMFYGLSALLMAVLNTKGVFKPGAWAPVANNVVSLVVLALYWLVPGGLLAEEPAGITDPHIMLLGVGTTLGVVVQALILIPPARKLGIDLRPLWGIDERLKQFGGMAVAIVVYVAISQAGYMITTRIAAASDSRAPMLYQQAWLLLQMPYGIIGVTLLTAIMPRLSRSAADGDDRAVVRDLTLATKLTYLALVPVIVFLTAFGRQVANGLFAYLAFDKASADLLGLTLSFSAFTLIPYALVLLHLRVFYAREEAWTPTFIIAGITTTKVLLSALSVVVASKPSDVVVLLGAANGFGFIAGAVIGALLLKRKLGDLKLGDITRTTLWAFAASLVGVVAASLIDWLVGMAAAGLWESLGSVGQLIRVGISGVVFLAVTGLVLFTSGLDEVKAFSRAMARIPGLRRFAPTTAAPTAAEALEEANQQAAFSAEGFGASPALPPMSAGVVRPPRLVAGAPVLGGRYRLLKQHGAVPGARFWQAREQTTGRQVALTFVDTAGAPPQKATTPAAAAAAAAEVARLTRKLAALGLPAVADNISVVTYRAGCLVVADWVDGAAVDAVGDVVPGAAAAALVPLAEAAGAAAAGGTHLGIDATSRLRVTTEGTVTLAFPAVLPGTTTHGDLRGIGTALRDLLALVDRDVHDSTGDECLACQVGEVLTAPHGTDLPDGSIRAAATLPAPTDPDAEGDDAEAQQPRTLTGDEVRNDPAAAARLLRRAAGDTTLDAPQEANPRPEDLDSGFGSRSYTRRGLAGVVAGVVLLMITIALAVTYVMGVISGGAPDSPIKHDAVTKVLPDTAHRLTTIGAVEWEAGTPAPGTEDNPELAAAVLDDDPATAWHTDTYISQFGSTDTIKRGVGLLITLDSPMRPTAVDITASTPGTAVEIYGVPDLQLTDISQAQLLGAGVLSEGDTTIELTPTGEAVGRVLVYVTRLPLPEPADIQDLVIKGKNPTPPTSQQATPPAGDTSEQPGN
ncbi:murein biosynthesis protein MurJ [Corynebacterium sp. 13CS0277]|uniref:murein biosynthesis integral membrane protein MurJ n=1 Tax=Corynebacterium sp. 13CS0277 TaxID=2071994 RepID=UPI000D04680D|nr:murein biosynthesis integral membrane protein MurJ [Corynebacterium sp. 13CS0277]PRQ11088.1 murein biosynthesis protein MurJ [Corynebacterium sp. 13CS0277]